MSATQTAPPPAPRATTPAIPGVAAANLRAQKLAQRIAAVVVVLPFLGLLVGIGLLWGSLVGPLEVGLLLGMFLMTSMGIGIGYHRLVSHSSFQTYRWIRAIFAVFGSTAAQGPVFFWAAIHRRHHNFSDRPGDPHSPNYGWEDGIKGLVRGLWHAHVGWMFVHEITDWSRYITDLVRDPILYAVNRLYFLWVFLGLAVPAAIGGLVTGTWLGALSGFIWGGLIRIFFVQHVTWSVNSLCHVYGTMPFRAPDLSRNNVWIALLSSGEGWHNNHHAFPYSARTDLRWWEVDVNGLIIRGLALVGLAWDLKVPTAKMMQEARQARGLAIVPEAPNESKP